MSGNSLQLKLQLLQTLRKGQIEQVHSLLQQISPVTKINPQLYQKFNHFIAQNKQGLIQMQKQQMQEQQQQKIVIQNIQGQLNEDQYDSDWSVGDSSSDQQNVMEETKMKTTVLKQINNKQVVKNVSSSSGVLKKDIKASPTNAQVAFKKHALNPSSSNLQTRASKLKN